jgi:hypothetical protein
MAVACLETHMDAWKHVIPIYGDEIKDGYLIF